MLGKKHVALCALRLIDPETERILSSQRWLYAQELSRLLVDMGYAVVWYQLGNGWQSEIIPGVPLVGSLPDNSQLHTWPAASNEFWETTGAADLAIYFDLPLAYPQVHENAIAIAHGIEWNHPLVEARLSGERERDEWKRRLWMCMSGPRRVVAVDTGVIQWATATWPGLYNKFVHIPNFVPTIDKQPRTSTVDSPNDKVRIVFGDELSPQAGITETLEVMGTIIERYPHVQFVIAGRGTPKVDQYVSRWANERDRVIFEPDGADLNLFRESVLLMPGKWNAGSSFSCLRGMAAGAAVVVGQTSGLTDLIIHDYNGWIIRPSAENIYKAVTTLIDHPGERKRLGENSRELAQAFTLDVWRKQWQRLIEIERDGR